MIYKIYTISNYSYSRSRIQTDANSFIIFRNFQDLIRILVQQNKFKIWFKYDLSCGMFINRNNISQNEFYNDLYITFILKYL